jgi:hypothetical protein
VRASVVLIVAFLSSACVGPHFERSLAATVAHTGDVGGRGAVGMIRGDDGWITQLVVTGESSGFFAAAGGLAWRKPTGVTPRAELAAGVATRSASLGGHCTEDPAGGTDNCTDGLGPYGELSLGLDVPLGDERAPVLTFATAGTLYLNSDVVEKRLVLLVGVAWK